MSLLVAVFNETTGWSGKTITYEDARRQFILQGHGPISAQGVLSYDAQGLIDWTDEGLREWTQKASQAAAGPAPGNGALPSPTGEPVKSRVVV